MSGREWQGGAQARAEAEICTEAERACPVCMPQPPGLFLNRSISVEKYMYLYSKVLISPKNGTFVAQVCVL